MLWVELLFDKFHENIQIYFGTGTTFLILASWQDWHPFFPPCSSSSKIHFLSSSINISEEIRFGWVKKEEFPNSSPRWIFYYGACTRSSLFFSTKLALQLRSSQPRKHTENHFFFFAHKFSNPKDSEKKRKVFTVFPGMICILASGCVIVNLGHCQMFLFVLYFFNF